jgi:glycosyltransferase involved in cell wall biosynthesis
MEKNKQGFSIVVPVFNEGDNVVELHRRILKACKDTGRPFEIIFVDDGSVDGTRDKLRGLTPLIVITFRKNFGQTAAMDAGIKKALFGYLITMDGDLQNDPADIPKLIEALERDDLDVVSGWRKDRKDSFSKRFVSRGANFLRRILINDGIHDSGCSLKIFRKECFEHVDLYGEMHRFIPALLKIKGFRIGEIVVSHYPRVAGKTKYNWKRSIKGFLDMLSVWFWNKFAIRPLHLLGSIGLFMVFLGICTATAGIVLMILGSNLFSQFLPLATIFFLISGFQSFVFGMLSDIQIKDYFSTMHSTYYSVKSVEETKEI